MLSETFESLEHQPTSKAGPFIATSVRRDGALTQEPVTTYCVLRSKRTRAGSVQTLVVPVGSTHGQGRSPKNAGFSDR